MPRTVDDFWYMVWQEKVQFIVMLANLVEEGKKKCACYWPEAVNESGEFGPFTVKLLEERTLRHVVTRTASGYGMLLPANAVNVNRIIYPLMIL